MSIASCLLLYSVAAALLAPSLLARLTRSGLAPRLGVTLWVTAMVSVVASWVAATGFLLADLVRRERMGSGTVINACFQVLGDVAAGRSGLLPQAGLLGVTVLAGLALMAAGWRLGRILLRRRARTHRHAEQARLVGRPVAGPAGAVILDAPERVAYCVAGRPHTIVVTSAAIDALDDRRLAAVLAHERAHLAGRHHLLTAFTQGLATVLPRIRLFTAGAAEVGRLLEMCADDAATRTHGPRNVLDALLILSGVTPIPHGALGATGVGVLARARRLAAPPRPADLVRARVLLAAVVIAVAFGPLLTAGLAVAGLALCGPFSG